MKSNTKNRSRTFETLEILRFCDFFSFCDFRRSLISYDFASNWGTGLGPCCRNNGWCLIVGRHYCLIVGDSQDLRLLLITNVHKTGFQDDMPCWRQTTWSLRLSCYGTSSIFVFERYLKVWMHESIGRGYSGELTFPHFWFSSDSFAREVNKALALENPTFSWLMAPMLIFRFWLPTITVQSNCIVTTLFSSDAAQSNYNCYDSISVFLTINENSPI